MTSCKTYVNENGTYITLCNCKHGYFSHVG